MDFQKSDFRNNSKNLLESRPENKKNCLVFLAVNFLIPVTSNMRPSSFFFFKLETNFSFSFAKLLNFPPKIAHMLFENLNKDLIISRRIKGNIEHQYPCQNLQKTNIAKMCFLSVSYSVKEKIKKIILLLIIRTEKDRLIYL